MRMYIFLFHKTSVIIHAESREQAIEKYLGRTPKPGEVQLYTIEDWALTDVVYIVSEVK